MPVTIERTELAYDGWFRVLVAHMKGADGAGFKRLIEDHGAGCAVLPYDPGRRVALVVRLPRAPVLLAGGSGEDLIEAPAGLIDDGEAPDAAGRREAFEETGVELGALEPLGQIWTMPGVSTERMWLYLAPYEAAQRTGPGGGLAGEQENITVEEHPLSDLARMADAGSLTDLKTLLLLNTLRLRRPDLFA